MFTTVRSRRNDLKPSDIRSVVPENEQPKPVNHLSGRDVEVLFGVIVAAVMFGGRSMVGTAPERIQITSSQWLAHL